ncbi:unnamed protein product [Psylliodes chrysocephalus]|uniref:Phosphoglucomutase-2 n=1 Tax=Psylliodes chrysocephalus TaxID=3402493 RepID=A0A9P0CMF2_9CUCU|nr:unnamed protein product [Psylliodes chrysocephala]
MADLDSKVAEWLKWDRNEKTSAALQALLAQKKFDEVEKILCNRISFGTAGLRGKMAVGYANMNDLVIIQTAQGFLKYLVRTDENLLKKNGIVVGYDHRHNSKRWAELTATIFINAGYPVILFGDVVPTPFVPFTILQYGCASGIVVTASHNPKDDNGYKVYGPNGAQICSPVDKYVQKSILENLKPLDSSWDTSILVNNPLLSNPLEDIISRYLNYINDEISPQSKELNKKVNVLFTYSAMHGVGYKYVQKVCDLVNARILPVPEQRDPHPDFPTVVFPNPEEGKSSLELSFKCADKNNCNLIIANDPDADRFAMAEKHPETNKWKIFTGNELGALFAWWMLHSFKQNHPDIPLNKVYMISSTVSSMICKSMSKIEGFNYIDTLTGFKWIANKALELEKNGNKVIFSFEEAIGFMCSTQVLDKDGISALAQMVTMASFVYNNGKTMDEQLEEIYTKYGYHVTLNSYYICHEPLVIKRIFERIRNIRGENIYPESILNGKYKIINVRDLTTGYDDNQSDKKAVLPVSSSSEMVTFNFENGFVCTLRTSGTEPKIKYYTEMCAAPGKDKGGLTKTIEEMVHGICEELFEPKKNNLKPQATD